MDAYKSIKTEILRVKQELDRLFDTAAQVPDLSEEVFSQWRRSCDAVEEQMSEDVVRVAVVGAIKSGKSTFINALLGADYLRRGAGVMTSIVTRIRGGSGPRATLTFKPWDEINADIEQALVLFPAPLWDREREPFDIRRAADREALGRALAEVGPDLLIRDGRRNENAILLSAYLEGYQRVAELFGAETGVKVLEGEAFAQHQAFVSADAMAVYLQDALLEIAAPLLEDDLELADCQGSDSPNPLHLSMIQDYLLLTHFIVYLISSRTGLRQADIRFLSMIREMGIIGNMIFVVNTDFGEHESRRELEALVERTRRDLAVIKPDPAVFAFSALYNLLRRPDAPRSERDRLRLAQWESDAELVGFCDAQKERFDAVFGHHLAHQRSRLLLGNHLERIAVVAAALRRWVDIHRQMLTRDADGVRELVSGIARHQKKITHLHAMVKTTLDGALQPMRRELKTETDRFFDDRAGGLLGDVLDFIRGYEVSYGTYREQIESAGFNQALYLVYQDFRQALDVYLTETIHPRVVKFVRRCEERMRREMETVVAPFDEMGRDSLQAYERDLGGAEAASGPPGGQALQLPDLEIVRRRAGIRLPAARMTMRYSARIRAEVVAHYGVFSLVRLARRLLRSGEAGGNRDVARALGHSVRRIKREMEKSMRASFLDYRENIKFQYLLKLLDAFSESIRQELAGRFQSYDADLARLSELAAGTHEKRRRIAGTLADMAAGCDAVEARIAVLKGRVAESASE